MLRSGPEVPLLPCNVHRKEVWAQALASPLSGLIGDKADRTKVVAAGCFLWGVMTSAIGLSTSISQVQSFFSS